MSGAAPGGEGARIERVLIANRGEIAVRIARTLRRLGITAYGVHSTEDRGARHVRAVDLSQEITGVEGASPYLNLAEIVAVARRFGVDAVHPGYGYLAEDPEAAAAIRDAGLIWIGPSPEAISLLGDKARSKEVARQAGVPVVPGLDEHEASAEGAAAFGEAHGYPIVLKASGGGGGKGMRRIDGPDQLEEGIAAARRESVAAFGSDRLLVERLVEPARHVEVQVAVDADGNGVALGERECSLQRRYQKLIEETPSPVITPERRERLERAAVDLALAAGYRNLGTVEFLVDHRDPDSFFFLEMNARLQVEHPVTELVTGLDLVELQLAIAEGRPLAGFDTSRRAGHAIEARICAERPAEGFLPATGPVIGYREPSGARCDSGIEAGSVVTSDFDPMLMKVIAHGEDRGSALERLEEALGELSILGVETNADYLRRLLGDERVRAGETTTGLVEGGGVEYEPAITPSALEAAAVALARGALAEGPGFEGADGWRIGPPGFSHWRVVEDGGASHDLAVRRHGAGFEVAVDGGEPSRVEVAEIDSGAFRVLPEPAPWCHAMDGELLWLSGPDGTFRLDAPPEHGEAGGGGPGGLVAPLPGTVLAVNVEVGERVTEGQVLMVVESMKMELEIAAPHDGVVGEIGVAPGDHVERGRTLAELAGEEEA